MAAGSRARRFEGLIDSVGMWDDEDGGGGEEGG
jgi:hypothetical protein